MLGNTGADSVDHIDSRVTTFDDGDQDSLFEVLPDLDRMDDLKQLVVEHQEMDFVPSHVRMINAEDELSNVMRREERLDMPLDGVDGQAEDMMAWFKDVFEDKENCEVFEVRKRVALQRAWNNGVSIFEHEEDSDMEAVYLDIAHHLEEQRDG